MSPTICGRAWNDIRGEGAKTASSYLVMSSVGGAVSPVLMGLMGERSMAAGFILPLVCFSVICVYSLVSIRTKAVAIVRK